jgi:meso-butanediol dehydrogenase/(S,S)-butanediol dehydrogenase/diacetyl reductase
MGRLDTKTCLVTGAARGIGRGIALRLASEGANVTVADLNLEGSATVVEEIEEQGGSALAVHCDVTRRESVEAAIAETAARFGRLDVMFNNAGISHVTRFLEISESEWEDIMRVNGLGVLLGMQEAARQFQRQGAGGKIVNTASIAGKEGFPLFAHYCASKFAVIALTQAGARALAADKITVNAFCPGVVTTELWKQLDGEFVAMGETERAGQALEEFGRGILLGRLSTPEDVAALAGFLASSDSDYITGQAFNVDGGMVLH